MIDTPSTCSEGRGEWGGRFLSYLLLTALTDKLKEASLAALPGPEQRDSAAPSASISACSFRGIQANSKQVAGPSWTHLTDCVPLDPEDRLPVLLLSAPFSFALFWVRAGRETFQASRKVLILVALFTASSETLFLISHESHNQPRLRESLLGLLWAPDCLSPGNR